MLQSNKQARAARPEKLSNFLIRTWGQNTHARMAHDLMALENISIVLKETQYKLRVNKDLQSRLASVDG